MFDINDVLAFAFVLMRMSGCIFFNPILGRRNFPAMVKVGFALVLTLVVFSSYSQSIDIAGITTATEYLFLLLKEFLVGYVIGFVITLFTSIIIFGGEIIDYQIGLSMSKLYDPQSNISMSLNATMYNILFMFMFFVTNAHLNLIYIFLNSAEIIPFGQVAFTPELSTAIINIFCQTTILAVKLSLPILAVEFLLEIGVGILMKAIPQINIFIINIQAKLLVGLIMIALFFGPLSNFVENLIVLLFQAVNQVMVLL